MRKLKVAAIAAAVVAVGVTVGVISLPASAEAATFAVTNSWSGGYQAEVTVNNDTSSSISTWKVSLVLPAGTTINNSWNATEATSGTTFTFTPASYNAKVAAGSATSFGFIATGNGRPTSCTVNGKSCAVSGASPSTSPASTPATASPSPSVSRTTSSPSPSATVSKTTAAPSPTASKTTAAPTGSTPLAINGQLHVCGVHLCNQYNNAIQLRGMSTHGLQFAPNCYNATSMDALATDWGADLLRIAMYVQEGGYATDPTGMTAKVNSLIDMAEARGMYAIADFHILNPGDPNANLANAKAFFSDISKRNAAKKNIIYEIANEPNGVSWASIKSYAEQIIPIIRANDPDAVIIVGTRAWSSLGVSEGSSSAEIINNPVNATNIMYTFHFYAASHGDNYRTEVQNAATKLPLFVTEFGTVTASGSGNMDTASSTAWLDLLDKLKISYANWTFSDINETSAALKPGTCSGSTYTGSSVLTPSGAFVKAHIDTPDNFPTN